MSSITPETNAEENEIIEEKSNDSEMNAENIKKLHEIFNLAGSAFSKLGDLTMHVQPNNESPVGKWTDEQIEMLRTALKNFSDDLNKITEHVKIRTVSQIRMTLKEKAFDDPGSPVRQIQTISQVNQQQQIIDKPADEIIIKATDELVNKLTDEIMNKSIDEALIAPESKVDVEVEDVQLAIVGVEEVTS